MKILIVTQYFWPENFKITDFALGLKELNHEVTILTGKPNYPDGKFYKGYNVFNKRTEYFNGIEIIRSTLVSRGNSNGVRLFINYLSFSFFASLTAIFRVKKNSDVIFVYEPSPITVGIPAIIYKYFAKVPMFFWVQDLWPESLTAAGNIKSKLVLNIIGRLVRFIYRHSEIIFISSRSFRKSIVEKGVCDEKIRYLPNWAEDIFLTPVNRNDNIVEHLPSGGFNIIFAGNIGDAQDFESIVNAIRLTRDYVDIHWIIIGDGRRKAWVEQQQINEKLDNLFLLGRFPIDCMPIFFEKADALLVTLKSDKIFALTVPAKIQSYLACGRPLLAMIDGEGADIINESKAGFAVKAGDYAGLAERAIDMYKMPKEKLMQMSSDAKEYYRINFNRKRLIENVSDIFQSFSAY
jgi:colanic acid biosynthesis glycosyl transferase WcaI